MKPGGLLLNAVLLITAHKRNAISDQFPIRFHGRFLERMKANGQLCPNPFAELCGLSGQEPLQVECHRLDRGTAVNGDFQVQSSVKPTNRQRGETEAGMCNKPKKSCEYCPQDEGSSLKRTIKPPMGIRYFGDGDGAATCGPGWPRGNCPTACGDSSLYRRRESRHSYRA